MKYIGVQRMSTFVLFVMKKNNYQFKHLKHQKTILVAPLHWGLGHATRCIPIIKALLKNNYKVLIGSDGAALLLLKKEFPQLPFIELPSYNITYPKKGSFFKLKLFFKLPEIKKVIKAEKQIIKNLVEAHTIQGIISDNRFGIFHKSVPSVFVTHQLQVLSGNTTYLSSKMHEKVIKKFNECWVPDVFEKPNLSGKLGHPKKIPSHIKFIGPLSRMSARIEKKKYDVALLLSGPEPQRSMLEEKLTSLFLETSKKILLIRGIVEDETLWDKRQNITIVNFLQTKALEQAILESEVVVSRSGYTTIMDLAALEKKAFFIPTPGQFEQEYLAKNLKEKGIVPSCKQEKFTVDKLNKIPLYKGLKEIKQETNFQELFTLFQGK